MPSLRRHVLPLLLVVATFLLPPAFGPAYSPLGVTSGRAQDDPLQATTRTVNVELILDASGSMAEVLPDGETRIAAAKRILRGVIEGLPERAGVNVGLRVYGHLGDNTQDGKPVSCRSSELLVPVAGLDKPALIAQVEAIQPTGWTPIAYALEQAAADFQPGGESITNAIVLVTDGEETCDPPQQSCDAASALQQSAVTVTTHVVGFALNPQQTELVSCIAEQGGGQLFGADDAAGLGTAIGSALEGVGVSITPVAIPPTASPAVPLAEIRTLAYHQLTQWTTEANQRGEEAPILSDDGQRIAFARAPGSGDPANPNRIFVINADGSGEQEVDAYTSLCFCGALIDISADGSRIVSSDAVQLRIAEASGGGGRELLALDSNEINAVRITGDGTTVVFRIYRDTAIRGTSPSQPIARGIYAINADGSGLRQLVGPAQMSALFGVTPDQAPFFGGTSGLDVSHDGSRIVFTSGTTDIDPATGGGTREGLFAVNGDGSGLHRLLGPTSTFVQANAVSGDGTTLAYVTLDFGTGLQQAGVLGFDGGGQRILTDSTSLHPGTGANLPSGERIQLSQDGSRLLLGSTGLLYDTTTGDVLALGIGTPGFSTDPAPLVIDGLSLATMDAAATRALYLFQAYPEPYQLVRVDLNPADLGGAPAITDPSLTPAYLLTEGRSTATVSARVSTTHPLVRVSSRVLREGVPDDNTRTDPLLDDGAGTADAVSGDVTANDGFFTSNGIYTDCCAEVGPRMVRIKAEVQAADGLRHATAIDVSPFQVATDPVEGGPPPTTTTALPATPVTPVTPEIDPGTVTPAPVTPPAADAAALATIAAQATRIAALEAASGMTPPAGITPPSNLITPTVPPIDVGASPAAGTETSQVTPAAAGADFTTPDPAECTTTPRSADALAALLAVPDQAATDALSSAALVPGLDVPTGAPADAATTDAVVDTYRQITACFNAGNALAAYALWTDDALRQFPVSPPPAGAPTALSEGDRSAFRVTRVHVLPDGRVVAVWEERGAIFTTTVVQALLPQDGRYLVDETLDSMLASDSGDALTASS
jgi:Tol biopolymer transport system component